MQDSEKPTPDKVPVRSWWKPALLGLCLFVPLAAAVGIATKPRTYPVDQPIAFNHHKHVVENEIDCSTCHVWYETQTFSGLPDASICETCHAEPLGTSAEEKRLVSLLREGRPLVWHLLFRQPPHIFYSHRRHVVVAKIECKVCHGGMGETERPPAKVVRLSMGQCIECHTKSDASTHCTSCHR